jgi:hypothetical protein
MCCFLLLGDDEKKYLNSLSEETPLSDKEREILINESAYKGKSVVVGLMKSDISAGDAAL